MEVARRGCEGISTITFWSSVGRLKSRLVIVQGTIARVVGAVERRASR